MAQAVLQACVTWERSGRREKKKDIEWETKAF
jgi:hypothetical protein